MHDWDKGKSIFSPIFIPVMKYLWMSVQYNLGIELIIRNEPILLGWCEPKSFLRGRWLAIGSSVWFNITHPQAIGLHVIHLALWGLSESGLSLSPQPTEHWAVAGEASAEKSWRSRQHLAQCGPRTAKIWLVMATKTKRTGTKAKRCRVIRRERREKI